MNHWWHDRTVTYINQRGEQITVWRTIFERHGIDAGGGPVVAHELVPWSIERGGST